MEDNEDEPNDVRQATPVNETLLQAEIDEETSSPLQEYQPQRSKIQQNMKEVPKKLRKPVKTKEECCEKKLKKLLKKSRDPKKIIVFINDEECTIKKSEVIPRHCLSKKEWINLLATPQRKCPANLKKQVERKLRPVSQRINELAQPTRQRMLSTLQDRGEILPTELVDKLVNVLEGETCLTPEQAEKLFHDKESKKQSNRIRKEKKQKCQSDMKILKSDGYLPNVNFDKEAVTCQYLMAEAFVKSILRWNSQIPKEEFKDIAEIILKRLADTLEYNLVDTADRTTQQMRFLADIIAAWIAGVLFEIAENQRDDLERACEERTRMKEEEETSDETTESEDEGFIPLKSEKLPLAESEKGEKDDGGEGMPRDGDKDGKRDDDKRDDDDDAGAGAAIKQEPIDESETPDISEAPDGDEKYSTPNSLEETVPEGVAVPEEETVLEKEVAFEETAPEEEAAFEEGAVSQEATAPDEEASLGKVAKETVVPQETVASEEEVTPSDEVQEITATIPDSSEPPSEYDGDTPLDKISASPESLRGDEEASIADTVPLDPTLSPTPKDSEVASAISAAISKDTEDHGEVLTPDEFSEVLKEEVSEVKLEADEIEVADVTQDSELDESIKLSGEIETEEMIERIGAKIRETSKTSEGRSDFIEGNLKKMLQTDVPFLDLLKILDRIENVLANENENVGDDLMTDRIHRAIYEKLERLVRAESPERLTKHLKDVLDVLSGKLAKEVKDIMTESEILYLNDNPPVIESGELRSFGEWLSDMSDRANNWTIWMQRMINQLVDMQSAQVTRGDWKNWTRNFATDALKWRHYYLESIHHAHHNRTMLAGREVVKTGELKYPEWSIQEKEINTTNFLQE